MSINPKHPTTDPIRRVVRLGLPVLLTVTVAKP